MSSTRRASILPLEQIDEMQRVRSFSSGTPASSSSEKPMIALSGVRMSCDTLEKKRLFRADAKLAHLPVYLITADVEAYGQSGLNEFNDILLKPITLDKLQMLFT